MGQMSAELDYFRKMEAQIASALSVSTSLKPEVALLLEIYEADRAGKALTEAMLGLVVSIPDSSLVRYVEQLIKEGAVRKQPNPAHDGLEVLHLSPEVELVLGKAFQGIDERV